MKVVKSKYAERCKMCGQKVEGLETLVVGQGSDSIGVDLCDKCQIDIVKSVQVINQHRCWHCGGAMIWQSDFSFEDYGMDEDGIVSVLCCISCDTMAEYKTSIISD